MASPSHIYLEVILTLSYFVIFSSQSFFNASKSIDYDFFVLNSRISCSKYLDRCWSASCSPLLHISWNTAMDPNHCWYVKTSHLLEEKSKLIFSNLASSTGRISIALINPLNGIRFLASYKLLAERCLLRSWIYD